MTLTERAARALQLAAAADPHHAHRDTATRRACARMARELAALLGVDPATVTTTVDPDRHYGGYPGHLITVTDNTTTYRFMPEVGSTDRFSLLGPCPGCSAEVPVADITGLADLGQYLTNRHTTPTAASFAWDRRHRPGCPYAATDDD